MGRERKTWFLRFELRTLMRWPHLFFFLFVFQRRAEKDTGRERHEAEGIKEREREREARSYRRRRRSIKPRHGFFKRERHSKREGRIKIITACLLWGEPIGRRGREKKNRDEETEEERRRPVD